MQVSRRAFSAGGLGLLATAVRAAPRPTVRLADYLRGAGPQTAALARAIADARRRRAVLVAPAGSILIDDDFAIDWDGFAFVGQGEGTRIVQRTLGRGFLQLSGQGNHVAGLHFAFEGDRRRPSGLFKGYQMFQRVCAVWLEGGGSLVEAVSAENSFNTLCLRGPVRAGGGADAHGRPTLDFTPRARGNRVKDIAGRSTDFVLTGNQQEDLVVDGLTAADTTNLSVPPHAIYMQNPGSIGAFCGYSKNVRLSRLSARNNPYGQAFKLSDVRGLTITDAVATACAGGALISTTDGGSLTGGRFTDLAGHGQGFPGISISQSNRFTVQTCQIAGRTGEQMTGVIVYHDSHDIDVVGVTVADRYPDRTAASPFRVDDTSDAEFRDCARLRGGGDKPMFVVGGTAQARIARAASRGSAQLVQAMPAAEVQFDGDGSRVQGFSPASLRVPGGPRRLAAQRRRAKLLPGSAGDASCPA